MPLHDWNEINGWDGVHHLWITELFHWVKPRLPEGYRVYIGHSPMVGLDEPDGTPDLAARKGPAVPPKADFLSPETPSNGAEKRLDPDEELAVATLQPALSLLVSREGWLVAAVELVSPRNKDRRSSRSHYTGRYAGYIRGGIHLLLVDVHPRPYAFSFADAIADELEFEQPRLPAPLAVAYRVGEPLKDKGSFLGIWRRPLAVGSPLPPLPLPLTVHHDVVVDLEQTYLRATEAAYLS